jgi:hypothetical protein
MVYIHMGTSGLYLYKGREGIIQKIDEINMEVCRLPVCLKSCFYAFFVFFLSRRVSDRFLDTDVFVFQLHRSSVLSDSLNLPVFCSPPAATVIALASSPAADGAAACSAISYAASSLAAPDALGYRSAGIILYDFERAEGQSAEVRGTLRLLMGRNHENKIEFLGGKREATDADVHSTAAREFDEESGGILAGSPGDVTHRVTLMQACRSSRVLWYEPLSRH